jgi:hypothetical protein
MHAQQANSAGSPSRTEAHFARRYATGSAVAVLSTSIVRWRRSRRSADGAAPAAKVVDDAGQSGGVGEHHTSNAAMTSAAPTVSARPLKGVVVRSSYSTGGMRSLTIPHAGAGAHGLAATGVAGAQGQRATWVWRNRQQFHG